MPGTEHDFSTDQSSLLNHCLSSWGLNLNLDSSLNPITELIKGSWPNPPGADSVCLQEFPSVESLFRGDLGPQMLSLLQNALAVSFVVVPRSQDFASS